MSKKQPLEIQVVNLDGSTERRHLTYVQNLETMNTGGGIMVDLIELKDGTFLGICDELVVQYQSIEQFYGDPNKGELNLNDLPLLTLIKPPPKRPEEILTEAQAIEGIKQVALGLKKYHEDFVSEVDGAISDQILDIINRIKPDDGEVQ